MGPGSNGGWTIKLLTGATCFPFPCCVSNLPLLPKEVETPCPDPGDENINRFVSQEQIFLFNCQTFKIKAAPTPSNGSGTPDQILIPPLNMCSGEIDRRKMGKKSRRKCHLRCAHVCFRWVISNRALDPCGICVTHREGLPQLCRIPLRPRSAEISLSNPHNLPQEAIF